MKEYSILGSTVEIDNTLEIYIRIKKAAEVGKTVIKNAVSQIYNNITDIDELIENLSVFVSELPKSQAELAVSILVKYDVYSMDEDLFLEKYYDKYFNVSSFFYPLLEKYYGILGMEDEIAEYQKALKESHKIWSGGGIGIRGALSGALKAQILNQANVAFHASSDRAYARRNEQTINRLKREMLNNPETLQMIKDSIDHIYDGLFFALTNELEEENVIEHYEFETKKAQAIYNNMMAHINEIDEDRVQKLCLQIIGKDILFYSVYLFMAIRYPDEFEYELGDLTEELGYRDAVKADLEEIQRNAKAKVMEEHEDEIKKIKEECEDVNNNETLFAVIKDCVNLMRENPILELHDEIFEALKNRMFFPASVKDGELIKSVIGGYRDVFNTKQRDEIYKAVDEAIKERNKNADKNKLYEKPAEVRNGFFIMADYSPVSYIYLYELGREGNPVAQDVIYEYFYQYAIRNDYNYEKFCNEPLKIIELFVPPEPHDYDNMNPFDLFWLGMVLDIKRDKRGEELIKKSAANGCAVANYYMYLITETPAREEYINKAVRLGSVTANIVMYNRTKEKNPELADKYSENLGYSREEFAYASITSRKRNFAEIGKTGNYGFAEQIKKWMDVGYSDNAIEEIKRIDKACKDRFYFYPLLLKKGTVRYLLEDADGDYNNMLAAQPPVIVNETGEYTCFGFVFSEAEIFVSNQGVLFKTKTTVEFEPYKTYLPGKFDYGAVVDAYPDIDRRDFNKLIEDVIAYMILYSRHEQRKMKEIFYPSLNCETDLCKENEKFDDDVNEIIRMMEQNDFKAAAAFAYDLSKKHSENVIAYVFYLAILKVAQDDIREDWFDEYSKIRDYNINRSDVLLEAGKVARSRTKAFMELPDNSVFEFYCKAASMGNREAIDFVSKTCKRNLLWGVSKDWAEQWQKLKEDCGEDKTNIFSLVEKIYLENGNKISQDPMEMPKRLRSVSGKKRYYDEDFNIEKRKVVFDKLNKFLNYDLNWKCQTYLSSGNCLSESAEKAMRSYYRISPSEKIYAFVDTGLPSRVSKGLVFTESAIYCVDSDHMLKRIAWNRLTYVDKIYNDGLFGFYFNGKRLFDNEGDKTRKICRYIDYGINPNRNLDLFGNNDIKSL